ncbi:deaminase [Sediminivirga luteola]|uniref:deaminase n=1 Tax=Sediminivirga luteola TaxID=1774748 RepID=UPI001F58CE39|nr:nucleoside deaminase [Sediminivirga luteola]MCI2266023.1 nucleoside deaminase [Sediminivirga luteola]
MSLSIRELEVLMEDAVAHCIDHVEAGGIPFVGVLADNHGYVSAPGVNLVHQTRDPSAHAEIVAMRQALRDLDRTDLKGVSLLATGEPCGLCYRFALQQGISQIYVAVDAGTTAQLGFDYRKSYQALRIDHSDLRGLVTALPVKNGLEPFTRYLELNYPHTSTATSHTL